MYIQLSIDQVKLQYEQSQVRQVDEVAELVHGLKRKERAAQEQFYKQYFGSMFPVAQRYARSKEDAQDIINTAFLKVIDNISKYTHQGNFEGWIRVIVKRTSIDYCRKFSYNKPEKVEILEIDQKTYNGALGSLELQDVMKLMKKLPAASQMVFNLYVFEDLSHKEIGEKLNISVGTSKWHLSTARKKLLELISAQD